ncbi:MFS transporter [Actinoplanes sp. NPDC024001]|uniref:MFS transporter n=1 Tax=Actinoplanes sp. NPDC024001 TaxID=3154598 RepID=UPI0033DBC08B
MAVLAPARRRESRVLLAATLANGPVELLDFLLPLWAGAALGASATQVGALVAAELAVSVVVRPFAGMLADACERRFVAAAGALIYALSCLGYALAGGLPQAYAAAVLGGLGGALLWVAVRAMAGERLAEDSAVYPRLTAAEETGAWVAFVAGLSLLSLFGYRTVFLACAGACLAAAVALASAPRRVVPAAPELPGGVARRLRPMLLAVLVTMAAEAAIALLLLLHLQRHFQLEIVQIAYVFLPGAIAMAVLPVHLHRFVLRFGRVRVLALASISSAVFATGLAWAPHPVVIALLWVLSGVAWAAVIPVQQAVVAEASGARVGRGMGLYESAVLLGSLAGSLLAGTLYDVSPWPVACLALAVIILAGAGLVPWSVRALGVADRPAPADRPARADRPASVVPPEQRVEVRTDPRPKPARSAGRKLGEHVALYLAVQAVLAVLDLSWVRDLATGAVDPLSGQRDVPLEGLAGIAYGAGRVWTIIVVIDVIWTAVTVFRQRR